MKNISLVTLLFVVSFTAAGAFGADLAKGKAADKLAHEIEARITSTSQSPVTATASECRLHIEFKAHQVSFDLPLQGTEVAAADGFDDTIFVSNARMTRTIRERGPESFEKLMLRFGRDSVNEIKSMFDQAIKSCGA